jgi:hypothetical protein
MTYLDWGCDPLRDECQTCLDALCSACQEDFKKQPGQHEDLDGLDEVCPDGLEPDCDRCELDKKPDCTGCCIILEVCRRCPENPICEFRIDSAGTETGEETVSR